MHQMSAAGITVGIAAAVGAWDIRGCKAGRSSEQCHEAGGRSSREENILLHCIHPVLHSCSAHSGAGHKLCVPTLPKSLAHGLYLPAVCPCPKIPWECRVMGLWRGISLQPSPNFSSCNPHLRPTRATWVPENPIRSPRHPVTWHNLGLISTQQHSVTSSRDRQQVAFKSRRDKPAQHLGSIGRPCLGSQVPRTCQTIPFREDI